MQMRVESALESLGAGVMPWGDALGGSLPPRGEIVGEYVGRLPQEQDLAKWFAGDQRQIVVWGYGGSGKSATAYMFAREIKEAAPREYLSACWVSAKKAQFLEGGQQSIRPDFSDLRSFTRALYRALYDELPPQGDLSTEQLMDELRSSPALIVVDDVDTVLGDDELAHFLLYELPRIGGKYVYTSRARIPGLKTVELGPMTSGELDDFMRMRAAYYELDDIEALLSRRETVSRVTEGYPLFVDELLRHSRIVGLREALDDWGLRRGDAAREYALRKQLDRLGGPATDCLIALAGCNRPLAAFELVRATGRTDADAEYSAEELLRWKLSSKVVYEQAGSPSFTLNNNTRRLVQQSFSKDRRWIAFQEALRAGSAPRAPFAMQRDIASLSRRATEFVMRGDVDGAVAVVTSEMHGSLARSAEVNGVLGWALSRDPERFVSQARDAFLKAHRLGNRREDTYLHWSHMEGTLAEKLSETGESSALIQGWQHCCDAAENGIEVVGQTQALCFQAAYGRSRLAKANLSIYEYDQAGVQFGYALGYVNAAFTAPSSPGHEVPLGRLYRAKVIALEGLGSLDRLKKTFEEWGLASPNDPDLGSEKERLMGRFSIG